MRIGFVGDVHGCAHQCLAAVLEIHRRAPLDAIIQVGDMGAWPDARTMFERDPPSRWFAEDNPRTLDWFDLLDASSPNAKTLGRIRDELGRSVLMIRGNHDDPDWLQSGPVDPFGLFDYVPDGSVVDLDNLRIGFLGGIELDPRWPDEVRRYSAPHSLDGDALSRLKAQTLDILVTHDGPHGVATNWRGETQGSKQITALVEAACPRWHVAGHYHHLIGPELRGRCWYVGLGCLVQPLTSRWEPGACDPLGCVQASGLVVLDTETDSLTFPAPEVVQHLDKDLDLSVI